MILLIDNYDSFTYNLVQLIGSVIEKKQEKEQNKSTEEQYKNTEKNKSLEEQYKSTKEVQNKNMNQQNNEAESKNTIKVIRNDELTVDEIESLKPSHIIISPGPGKPRDAGICEELILHMKNKAVILGVCLGHQGICEAFGSEIVYAKELMHGKRSAIEVDNTAKIFKELPKEIVVGRYHSLAVKVDSLSKELEIIAKANDGEVMAVKHKDYEVYGVQFHPESVLTKEGEKIISNFFMIEKV